MNIEEFFDLLFSGELDFVVKRLSGNDTGANGSHQVGIYLPREYFERSFPEICTTKRQNPKSGFETVFFPQYSLEASAVVATYYNNRFFGGTRNEFRLTNWGGKESPIQDHENTGSIMVLAKNGKKAYAWIAQTEEEELLIEEKLAQSVDPKDILLSWKQVAAPERPHWHEEWKTLFPKGYEIFEYVESHLPYTNGGNVDRLLLKRRELEFQVFREIEAFHLMPNLSNGFDSVDEFLKLANSVTNRRKSRSGRSLELGLESIFRSKNIRFETQVITEHNNRPDFIFPSIAYYRTAEPEDKALRMLAAKTCCKDRWRQVVREAGKISKKHLFTLQEGASLAQIQQMKDAGIHLVIPEGNRNSFPKSERKWLTCLGSFCDEIVQIQSD